MTRILSCALALSLLAVPAARAQSLEDALTARLLPGWRVAADEHIAAVEFRLAPGWKTYWRAPGDAGIPPQFDWSGSGNLKSIAYLWPRPEIQMQGGFRVLGYRDRLVLPLRVTPEQAGQPVELTARVDLGVCKDVCLPLSVTVAGVLPAQAVKRDSRIVGALSDQPLSGAEAGVGRVVCTVTPLADGLRLVAEIDLPALGGSEMAVVEAKNPQIWIAQSETRRDGGRLIAETELYHVEGRAFALDRSGLRLTVISAETAVDIRGCPAG